MFVFVHDKHIHYGRPMDSTQRSQDKDLFYNLHTRTLSHSKMIEHQTTLLDMSYVQRLASDTISKLANIGKSIQQHQYCNMCFYAGRSIARSSQACGAWYRTLLTPTGLLPLWLSFGPKTVLSELAFGIACRISLYICTTTMPYNHRPIPPCANSQCLISMYRDMTLIE